MRFHVKINEFIYFFQDLAFKNQLCKEQQDKRFEQERTILVKNYENELQSMIDQQKKQVEKAEEQQHVDLKVTSKKIRAEQEKELKTFRESLKQELKLLKQEVDLLPKSERKEALKARKEALEHDQQHREQLFLAKLNDVHESSLKRLSDTHKEKIALLDRQFLQQKQQLLRAREAAIWVRTDVFYENFNIFCQIPMFVLIFKFTIFRLGNGRKTIA